MQIRENFIKERKFTMKKSIKDLGDIRGKRALVRVDINVPLDEN
jgi:3-phosphoglycerate kinase